MGVFYINGFRHYPVSGDRMKLSGMNSNWSQVDGRSGQRGFQYTSSTASSNGSFSVTLPDLPEISIGFAVYAQPGFSSGSYTALGWGISNANGDWIYAAGIAPERAVGSSSTNDSFGGGYNAKWSFNDSSILGAGWNWWNVVFKADATNGYCWLFKNGNKVMEANGDTIAWGGGQVRSFAMYVGNANPSSSRTAVVSDLVIRNDTLIIPDSRVDVLMPNSDITAQWKPSAGTSNYALVGDPGPEISLDTYVSSNTVGNADTYGVEDLPVNPTAVEAVQLTTIAGKTDSGPRTMAHVLNGVESTAVDTGGQTTLSDVYDVNPATGSKWTKASIDSLTVGVVLKS